MKTLTEQLVQYAAYHRDRRNIATHFVGIPMILFSVVLLFSRPQWSAEMAIPISPALLLTIGAGVYYMLLDRPLGLLMSLILACMLKLAAPLAAEPTRIWLSWGIGLFVLGWIIQAVGHVWEGKKPAFFDDVIGLIIGPLFVTAEFVFALGARAELLAAIEAKVGKTRVGKS